MAAGVPGDADTGGVLRRGSGPPLLLINGLAATKEDWDPSFIEGLASRNELRLLDNRGMGASRDEFLALR